MAADQLAHAPLFTPEEIARLHSGFARTLVNPEEADWLDVVIYGWTTTCWQCDVDSYVWMSVVLFGPAITEDCLRPDIRRALAHTSATPHALIGTVTTKAGGTYLGFTCPWCHSVLGKHFLTIELYRRLLDNESGIDKHRFEDAMTLGLGKQRPLAAPLTELSGGAFPQTRARQFTEWRARADKVIAYRNAHKKYPAKREDSFIHQTRVRASEGTLASERRAYLDIHLSDWDTTTVTFPREFDRRVDAVAAFKDEHGSYPDGSAKDAAERRLASWLLGQRVKACLGRMSHRHRMLLDGALNGWDTQAVPDWYSKALRLRDAGLDTTDPELSAFLDDARARLTSAPSRSSDWSAVLDRLVPGWEAGPGFTEWMEREADYCQGVLDAGRDSGHDMIHDHEGVDDRFAQFFGRVRHRHAAGRIDEDELAWLCQKFDTLPGYLGLT